MRQHANPFIGSANHQRRDRRWTRMLSFFMATVMLFLLLTSCNDRNAVATRLADYGEVGADYARTIARQWPDRSAGSDAEAQTADYIESILRAQGYHPERQAFSFKDASGSEQSSQNVLVRIPGAGFVTETDEASGLAEPGAQYFSKTALVMARMDTLPVEQQVKPSSMADSEPADGIHDNASGLGTLLLFAEQLRAVQLGYDVLIAFTGAGFENEAGANALKDALGEDGVAALDVCYEVRAIYAGDKLYVHSGHNSLVTDQRYAMRRKLYEVIDSSASTSIIRHTNVRLRSNQSSFLIDSSLVRGENLPEEVVYREITLTDSDYKVFDELGIPIVMFESYDYDGTSLEDIAESRNPYYADTDQSVRGTIFDQTDQQLTLTDSELLHQRINTVAFLLIHALNKGVSEGVAVSDS